MKKKQVIKITTIALTCLLLISVISIYAIPRLRVNMFVHTYHELIEKSLSAGNGVPADDAVFFGYDVVNYWDKTHPMTEFVIVSYGDTYYGCYYSPDDVPLAFQNFAVELTQGEDDYWEWKADGDNHGATSKIIDHWYYFEATF